MKCACGAEATANGRECPVHYRARLRSLRFDNPTQTKTNYFDTQSLDETFGEDRRDRYWDETGGHGALHRDANGNFWHEDFRGERKIATDDVISSFVDGEDAADAV